MAQIVLREIALGRVARRLPLLSKSQARLFFLVFTVGFSAVFLGLTVDTIQSVPERSHEDKLTEDVIRGKVIWEANNCMGCHTLLGEGAYYAPELTKVYDKRGPEWIDIFLQDPERMFPGQRKMVKYDFTPEQRQDVIAFFEWIGNIDTNGFPRAPDLVAQPASAAKATAKTNTKDAMAGAPVMMKTVCAACHSIGGTGGNVGPALDGVANRYDRAKLDRWLSDPEAVKPGTKMPNLALSEDVRKQLVDYLMTLEAEASQ